MAKPKKPGEAEISVGVVTPETIVHPIIRVVGQRNVFEVLEEEGNLPELKSIGMCPVPGSKLWVSYVIISKGNKVLRMEVSEPDHRAIPEEASKTAFSTLFMNAEGL